MCWLVWTSKDLGGRPPLASRCISLSWLFFHGGNTGSNPVGDAKSFQELTGNGHFWRRHKKAQLRRQFLARFAQSRVFSGIRSCSCRHKKAHAIQSDQAAATAGARTKAPTWSCAWPATPSIGETKGVNSRLIFAVSTDAS
jgi:hypothetical protein